MSNERPYSSDGLDWYISDIIRRLRALESRSSGSIVFTSGSNNNLTARDTETGVETVIGELPDGTYGLQQHINDVEPPPVATAPVVSSKPGLVVISWDGNFVAGTPKPNDFVMCTVIGHKVENGVVVSQTAVGIVRSASDTCVVSLDVAQPGEHWQFSLEATDYNGNRAALSTKSAEIIIQSVVDAAIGAVEADITAAQNAADAAQTAADNAQTSANNAAQSVIDLAGVTGAVYTQTATPTADPNGLWIDTGHNNIPRRYLGTRKALAVHVGGGANIGTRLTALGWNVTTVTATPSLATASQYDLVAFDAGYAGLSQASHGALAESLLARGISIFTSGNDTPSLNYLFTGSANRGTIKNPIRPVGTHAAAQGWTSYTDSDLNLYLTGVNAAAIVTGVTLVDSLGTDQPLNIVREHPTTFARWAHVETYATPANVLNAHLGWVADNWVAVQDQGIVDASNAAATAQTKADQAFNNAATAATAAGTAQTTADGKNRTWYQTTAPAGTSHKAGDLWFDTDDGNKLYMWQTTPSLAWVSVQDAAISTAQGTANTALTSANGKNKNYYQTTQPTGGTYIVGDNWFDTDDNYKLYTYNGTIWQLTQDSAGAVTTAAADATTKADAAAAAAVQSQAYMLNPSFDDWASGATAPNNYVLWGGTALKETSIVRRKPNSVRFTITGTGQAGLTINTNLNHAPNIDYLTIELEFYLASGTIDGAGILIDWNNTAPTYYRVTVNLKTEVPTPDLGKWYRITKVIKKPSNFTGTFSKINGYLMGSYSGITTGTTKDIIFDWLDVRPATAEEITAYGTPANITTLTNTINAKTKTYFQTTSPGTTGNTVGDIWFDTSNGNKPYVWNGSAWTSAQDAAIATAQGTANTALTSANGKNKVYYQTTMPTGGTYILGDTWFDTDDGNRISVYNGTTFVSAQDSAITTAQNTANTKTKTYFQATSPGTTGNTAGDIWFDTSNGNLPYVWNGSAWTSARDTTISAAQTTANTALTSANGKNKVYYQTTSPGNTGNTIGDTWFDTANGNKISVWNGSAWVSAQDTSISTAQTTANNALTTANSKTKTYFQTTQPGTTGNTAGDIWFDTANGNKPYVWNGTAWTLAQDAAITAAQTSANGKNKVWYQTSQPPATGNTVGDTWFDTDDGNKIYVWSGSAWVNAQDATIATAQSTATNALNTATSKTKTFFQTSQPSNTGNTIGDTWFDTDDGYRPYVWNGSAWTDARDAAISTAQTTANTALTSANGKNRVYYQTAMPTGGTYILGDTWFDTDDGNKIYVYNGTTFALAQDAAIGTAQSAATGAQTTANSALTTANSKTKTYFQTTSPGTTGNTVGDIWFNTADSNKVYVWNGSSWASARDAGIASAASAAATAQQAANDALSAAQAAQAVADGAIRTWYQATAPTGLNATSDTGDLWFDTDDGQAYRWNGTAWIIIEDNSIAAALAAAQNAQTTADGKITTYYQPGQPATGEVGDLWFDTDDKNKPYYCSSISPLTWTVVRDGAIADAQTTANNALTSANGKNKVYYQTTMPTGGTYILGDTWFDTDDGNKIYVYNGTTFVVAQDTAIGAAQTAANTAQTTANAKTKTYFQTTQPSLTGNTNGDIWFDTSNGNKPYVWNGAAWASAQDAAIAAAQTAATNAQTSANGKNKVWYQTSQPPATGNTVGDTWFDTDDGNKIYVWSGSAWVNAQDATIATAQSTATNALNTATSKTKTYYQATSPGTSGNTFGDTWFDTSNGNKPYVWNGSTWISAQDASIASAQSTASTALTTANGKNKSYYQTAMPTGGTYSAGDIWFDTDDNYKLYTYNGSAWVLAQDSAGSLAAAITAAGLGEKIAGKWLYANLAGIISASTPPAPTDFAVPGVTRAYVSDGTDLVKNVGDTYRGSLRTMIRVATTKTISFTATHDDAGAVYLDGTRVYTAGAYTAVANISLTLSAGWHVLELLWTENTGGDGWYAVAPVIGTLVDELAAPTLAAASTWDASQVQIAAAADATAKSDAAQLAGIQSSAYSLNPSFDDWTGSLPNNYGLFVTAPTKETTTVRTGKSAVRFNCTDTTTDRGLTATTTIGHAPNLNYYTIEVEVRLMSGTSFGGAGVLLDWAGMTNQRVILDLSAEIPAPITGKWYRVVKVFQKPANATGTWTGMAAWLMGQYGIGTRAIKDIVFDWLNIRPSTTEEITSFGTPATITTLTNTVNTKTRTYFQTTQPSNTGNTLGDMWFDTGNGNKVYVWNGSAWTVAQDTAIAAAQTSANGKNRIYYQTAMPTGGTYIAGDTWFDTDDGYKIYVHNGTTFVASALGTSALADLSITNAKIADATIASAKIAQLDAGKITTGTLDANRIGADTITATHIASDAITANELAANSITAAKGQISDAAIVTAKIADAQITNAKIADLAVTNAKIADATIASAKIAQLDAGKITTGTLDANRIGAKTVTADKLFVGDFTDLYDNGGFLGPTGLENWSAGSGVVVSDTNFLSGKALQNTTTGSYLSRYQTRSFEAQPGDQFYLTGTVYSSASGVLAPTFRMIFQDSLGNNLSNQGSSAVSTSGTYVTRNVSITAPAGTVSAKMWVEMHNPGGGTQIIGDLSARRKNTGNLIVDGAITATSAIIVDGAIGTAKIGDLAVTNAKIADLAVNNAKIADATIQSAKIASLDAGKITTGTLDANRISASSITTDKLSIGDFTNLLDDPDFNTGAGWGIGGQSSLAAIALGVEGAPTNALRTAANGTLIDVMNKNIISVLPGDKFYGSIYVKSDAAQTVGTIHFASTVTCADNTKQYPTFQQVAATSIGTSWTLLSGVITIPANAVSMQARISVRNDVTTGQFWWDHAIIRRQNTAVTIADGTITAGSAIIATGAIGTAQIGNLAVNTAQIADSAITNAKIANLAVDNAKIADATIQSAKIANLDAGKITTGILDANRIGADTITATHIASDAVTANELAANSITAAKGQISDLAVTTAKIADLAVSTAKIADLAVNNAKIADATIQSAKIASLDAGKITTGTLDANRIGANTVTTDKLVVGDFTDLVDNGTFESDLLGWANFGAAIDTATPYSGTKSAKFTGGNSLVQLRGINVTPGEKLYVSAWYKTTADKAGSGGLRLRNQSGSEGVTWATSYDVGVNTAWTQITSVATVAAGSTILYPRLAFALTAGTVWIDNYSIRRQSGAVLIADGTITAGSAIIATGAIGTAQIGNLAVNTAQIADSAITNAKIANLAVDNAKIADLAVTNAKIADATIASAKIAQLDAGKITTGTLDANRIGADTITATHIASDAITANELAANSITAAKGQISDLAVTTAKIADLAITNAKIADATIQSAKISALDAGKITTGTLDANRIGANTITATKLNVTVGGTNMVANSSFEADSNSDGLADSWAVWTRGAGDAGRVFTNTRVAGLFPGSTYAQRVTSTTVTNTEQSSIQATTLFAVGASVSVGLSLYARASVAGNYSISVRCEDDAGAYKGDAAFTAALTTTAARYSGIVVTPAGTTRGKITVTTPLSISSGHWFEVDGIQAELGDIVSSWGPLTSELLPGTINASMIAAGTIAAGSAIIATGAIGTAQIANLAVGTAQIADTAITNAKIADLAVTNAKIADATIASAKIAQLDAGKITTGTLDANRIAADSITASKLSISDFTNLVDDSELVGVGWYDRSGVGTASNITVTVGLPGPSWKLDGVGTEVSVATSAYFSVTPGSQYFMSVKAQNQLTGTAPPVAYFRIYWFTETGAASATPFASITIAQGNWNTFSGTATAPADARRGVPTLIHASDATGGSWWSGLPIVRRKNEGSLIVDGAIQAGSAIIGNLAVGTAQIADTAITTAKIGNLAVGTAQIADTAITNAKIANLAVDNAKIADLAITNAKIADATIASAKISQLDAGKITTGLLDANRIGTSVITTDKLLIADLTNLWENPDFEADVVGQQAMGTTNNGNATVVDTSALGGTPGTMGAAGNGSSRALALNALNGSNNDVYGRSLIPVKDGDQFYIEYEGRHLNTTGTGNAGIGFRTYGPTKAGITWTNVAAYGTTKSTVWAKKSGTFTVPVGTAYIQPWVTFSNNAETTNRFWVDNIVIRRKANATVVVDGLIQAGSAIIGNGAIANAQIANLDAAKITTGTLAAARIGAKSITTDKLVITSTDNLVVEADFSNNGASWGTLNANKAINATAGRGSLPALRVTGSTALQSVTNLINKVTTGSDERLRGAFYVKSTAALVAGAAKLRMNCYTTASAFTTITVATSPVLVANTWTLVEGIATALPANTIAIEFLLEVTNDATGTITDIDYVAVTRAMDGRLVVDGTVTANKLETTLVLSSTIVAGDPTGTHARMDSSGFRVFAADPSDNIPNEVVRMGVASSDDYFAVSRSDGSLAATISQDGIGSFDEVNSNEVWFKGRSLSEILWNSPLGHVGSAYRTTYSAYNAVAGQARQPYLRYDVELQDGRLYKVSTSEIRMGVTVGGNATIYMTAEQGGVANENSPILTMGEVNKEGEGVGLMELWTPTLNTTAIDARGMRLCSFLIAFSASAGECGVRATPEKPVRIVVEDVGPLVNTYPGTFLDGANQTPPPPQQVTYVRQYTCTTSMNYDGNNNQYNYNTGQMYQGLSPAGLGNLKSIGIMQDMTADLSGASINYIRVFFNFNHWYYNSGGTARIGVHGNTGIPGTFNWAGGGTVVTSGGWPKPGARWVDIPSEQWNGFKTGQWRGVTLEGDGTYGTYGYADRPVIEISYTK